MTTLVTQAIAGILRAELSRSQHDQKWLGHVVGRSQAHVSQVLQGKKPFSTDELALACKAFGLTMLAVVQEAETRVSDTPSGEDGTGATNVR